MPLPRLALITGATSGIGEALAYLLHQEKIPLLIGGRDQKRLKLMGEAVQAKRCISGDLSKESDRKALLAIIQEEVPDLVINNAGFGLYGEGVKLSVEEQLAMVEVNAKAVLALTLGAAHALLEAGRQGIILNVSSAAGEQATPGMSVYGATKGFVTLLSEGLDMELSPYGIRVLVSCPGMVATPFSQRAARKPLTLQKGALTMTPSFAAQKIWEQIKKKKEKYIFDWSVWGMSLLAKYFIPKRLVKKIIWRKIKQRL